MEHLFVSTTPGLEPVLARECAGLGTEVAAVPGGVELRGPAGLLIDANLRLRTASRVLLRVAELPAGDLGRLRERMAAVDLRPYLRPGAGLSVTVHGSSLSRGAVAGAAKRAWSLGAEVPEPAVFLRVERERCTVSVDTSGELLHRRGYRQEGSRAPLRETLAAGVLLLGGFDGDGPLVDPMCGSGTFLIEGALFATRRAPGTGRTFAFQQWPGFERGTWDRALARARAEARAAPAPILGSDINAGALGTARRNARRAGVGELLRLERRDVGQAAPAGLAPGLLVANPPYGKRVGERGELGALYASLAACLGRFAGWRAAVLVEDARRAEAFPLESRVDHPVDNGGLACTLVTGICRASHVH